MERYLKATIWLLPLMLIALVAGAAEKKDAAYWQKQFGRWTGEIAKLQKANTQGSGTDSIERIRTMVGQSQALAAAEKFGELPKLEQRIDLTVRFTQAQLDRVAAEAAAEAAEKEAGEAEAAAEKAKAEADQLDERFKSLEAKGL